MSTSAGTPPTPASILVKRIAKGDTFPTSDAFRVAFERNMMVDGRQLKADKRVSGGKSKLYRCTGAVIEEGVKGASGCPVFVRGCRHADHEWHVTGVNLDHCNCAGQSGEKKKRPSRKAMREDAEAFVNANHKITSPALVKTMKGACGVDTVPRTANRMKADILNSGDKTVGKEYMALDDYLTTLQRDSPGTIVDCEVSKRVMVVESSP